MLAIQDSPTTPTYAFASHDEVIIHDTSYRPLERRTEGYIFVRTDGTEVAEFFDKGKLANLVKRGRLKHHVGAFLPAEARRRLVSTASLVSAAPDDVTARSKRRLAFAEAFLEMEALGHIKRTDDSINAAMLQLQTRAGEILGLNTNDQENGEPADKNVVKVAKEASASSIRRWLKSYEDLGPTGLFDALPRSGNRTRQIGAEELAVMGPIVAKFTEARTTQQTIIKDVHCAFERINEARDRDGLIPLDPPSRETIRKAIKRLDPYQVYVAQKGEAAARKKYAPVGKGLQLTRPLERVEIDEWTIDLFSICAEAGLIERLSVKEKRKLGLSKSVRWKISVAICATTRCILAMRLSLEASAASAIQTMDMIVRDKGVWSDAFSALTPWDMAGVPELIVTDCGSAFISHETRAAMQDLGIRGELAPKGFPEMRARIERFFRTAITGLLPRLTGRTYSDVIEKGDIDPKERAALTTDELSEALVRWVVDVYHNTPHEGLGGETPRNCWRRLSSRFGVRPPPDMRRRRLVFGTRMTKPVSKKGIRVLGVWYHTEALARWWIHSHKLDVQVRWHQEDIGAVEVNLDGSWVEVPAVFEDVQGVRAEAWVETVRQLRASNLREAELSRSIVRQAIEQIEAINERAMTRQELLVQDWSEDQLEKMEDRLMIGFEVAADEDATDSAADGVSSGWGYRLPTAGRAAPPEIDSPEAPEWVLISAPRSSTASTARTPVNRPEEPDDEGADLWTSETK